MFKFSGVIRHVETIGFSTNGNSRKMVIIDPVGRTDLDILYTKPDSSLAITVSNMFGKTVKGTAVMYRGKLCIDSIEEV